jgi:hypothetical protein
MHILPVFTIRFFNYSYKLNLIQEIRFTHFFENILCSKISEKETKIFYPLKRKSYLQSIENRPAKYAKTDTLAKYAKQIPFY